MAFTAQQMKVLALGMALGRWNVLGSGSGSGAARKMQYRQPCVFRQISCTAPAILAYTVITP